MIGKESMMVRSRAMILGSFVACSVFVSGLVIALAAEGLTENRQKDCLAVFPSFSSTLDSPKFVMEFTNKGDDVVAPLTFWNEQSIILDGKEYPRRINKIGFVAGKPWLEFGETWQRTMDIASFLPNPKKGKYSEKLGRWRWEISLKSGTHTLIVKFGDYESKPVKFVWDGSKPLLYE